ncbi:ribonuclease P protein component [Niallia sp. NCCP-28]|uniref:ribonuclease P protein component n=1 Tax=Niallia sp. NCCP-28 TaxID=2934712 RepID=UPI00208D20F4|nr:ribonuclease P protein component [Niallia sp. NCCP-28]GKU83884.1 ribonuclease P protein component [Niallia sp. NCCP-28]
MKKEFRIKKNKDFQEVFKKGQSFANRQFVVYKLSKKNQDHFRIGLSVSKKIGNAVTRNRIKRYIRQAFLELELHLNPAMDYVIIARKPVSDMSYEEVLNSLKHVLKIAKIIIKKNE